MALFGIGKSDNAESRENSSILDLGKKILKDAPGIGNREKERTDDNGNDDGDTFFDIKSASQKPVKMALKGSGLLLRKVYEARINVVNEFSDIKPDWYFIDIDTIKTKIRKIEVELKNELKSNGKVKESRRLKKLNRLLEELLVCNALMDDNLDKCYEIVEEYDLSTPFAIHGLNCLQAARDGIKDKASTQAMLYYQANNKEIEHPIIALFVAMALCENGAHEEALGVMKIVVKCYPDSVEGHKLLHKIHLALGNNDAAQLEEAIISLLN